MAKKQQPVEGRQRTEKKSPLEQITELEQKIEQLTEDLKRAHADFVNYRRRNEEEKAQIMAIAKKDTVAQFLPVLDDLERALEHLPADTSKDQVAQGFKLIAAQIKAILANEFGVQEIQAEGEEFNPHLHEAVEFNPSTSSGQGDKEIVTEVLKKGYQIGELVLRPAVVRVGKGGKQ